MTFPILIEFPAVGTVYLLTNNRIVKIVQYKEISPKKFLWTASTAANQQTKAEHFQIYLRSYW